MSPLQVTRLIRHEFDLDSRLKGEAYARQGRVTLTEFGDNEITASVQGSKTYHVTINYNQGETSYYCSCPHFGRGWACKHIWATAVKVDEHARPRPAPKTVPMPKNAGWKDLLRADREKPPAHAWPKGARIEYVVDFNEVKEKQHFVVHVQAGRTEAGEWVSMPELLSDLEALPDPADAALFSIYPDAPRNGRFVVDRIHMEAVLPLLARTGRLILDERPAKWDEGEPWTVALKIENDGNTTVWGRFERKGETLDLRAPQLTLATGFLFFDGIVSRFVFDGPYEWIRRLRERGPLRIPKSEVGDFLAEVYATKVPVEIPEPLRFAEVRVPPQGTVTITSKRKEYERRPDRFLAATVAFDYLGFPAARGDAGPRLVDPLARRVLHRDVEAESAMLRALALSGFRPVPNYRRDATSDHEIDAARLPVAVPKLIEAGWRVEADGFLYRAPGKFRLEVSSGVDWFDLKGGVAFGDEVVPFPALLKAARRGDRHVVLGDGSFGLLPEDWLKRSGIVLGAGEAEGDALRFRPGQAMLLDALLAAEERAVADPGFERARREMRRFDSLAPAEPPKEFLGELRPYQKLGLGWFDFLRRFRWGGCLADDMGLGKTVQALALLVGRRGPSLVVVPRSLIFNWKSEAARFAPSLKIVETPRKAESIKGADLVLTTYGLLRRDAPFLKDVAFDYVILDEAQAIKNPAGATAKAARLLKAEHRLAMSGTPIENHLGELWSLMEFLNPGLLGAASVFGTASGADDESRRVLARALRPFILRRTKEQVAPELPSRTEQTVLVDLDPEERRRYDELKEHYRRTLLEKSGFKQSSKFVALEALLRLRQAACHGGLIDPSLRSHVGTKLEVLIERLREVAEEGHKALVFSQFTTLLGILRGHLDKAGMVYEYLDGATRDRESRVRRFQEDAACPFFLISLKAGGLGLNLTAAEYVFLLDPWWNPASEAQAIDRAHRIGQRKAVMALRIVARDTVEERVIELQKKKRALADAILSAEGGLMRGLTREDLALLLS